MSLGLKVSNDRSNWFNCQTTWYWDFSQPLAEEVGNQKVAAQYIYRELHGADEANLLDEKGDAYVQAHVSFIDLSINNVFSPSMISSIHCLRWPVVFLS